jgi:hypothetical protein
MIPVNLTKFGSVRENEGTFYSTYWREIFTPLTLVERQAFINAVGRMEEATGRKLSNQELIEIVKKVGSG